MITKKRGVRGILLDVDGTLLDSNDAHARAWQRALAEIGHDVALARLRELIGMGADNLLPTLGIPAESAAAKKARELRRTIFEREMLPGLRPCPGARALVSRFVDDDLACVVASSASKEEIDALLEAARVRDLIDAEATASDAASSKPDPDIVVAAICRSKLPPDDLILLGDTPYDVEAATRAGVRMVGVRCGGWDDAALRGALAVYDDPADLLARYGESPMGLSLSEARRP